MSPDDATLGVYAAMAATYAARERRLPAGRLDRFLSALPQTARVLELGCGGGQDAAYMLARGFDVTPTDGSPELAAEAERLLGRPVRVMLFEQLQEAAVFDGVWASASLLHVPRTELTAILGRVHHALKPGGVLHASFKTGGPQGRDRLGRYYNRPSPASLRRHFLRAGEWHRLDISRSAGSGYDGERTDWLWLEATKSLTVAAR